MSNLKAGDVITVKSVTGKIIRFQPKTQDVIVEDSRGNLHTFLHSSLINKIETQEE